MGGTSEHDRHWTNAQQHNEHKKRTTISTSASENQTRLPIVPNKSYKHWEGVQCSRGPLWETSAPKRKFGRKRALLSFAQKYSSLSRQISQASSATAGLHLRQLVVFRAQQQNKSSKTNHNFRKQSRHGRYLGGQGRTTTRSEKQRGLVTNQKLSSTVFRHCLDPSASRSPKFAA